jgi:hypothetical protein
MLEKVGFFKKTLEFTIFYRNEYSLALTLKSDGGQSPIALRQ